MLTAFGKYSRKLRIDRGELLKDMADKLGVTASYLSAIETGKRNVPMDWADKIRDAYSLDFDKYLKLSESIDLSKEEVTLNLRELDKEDKTLALSFARVFSDLNEDDKIKIKSILSDR